MKGTNESCVAVKVTLTHDRYQYYMSVADTLDVTLEHLLQTMMDVGLARAVTRITEEYEEVSASLVQLARLQNHRPPPPPPYGLSLGKHSKSTRSKKDSKK